VLLLDIFRNEQNCVLLGNIFVCVCDGRSPEGNTT